jgi:hypothetical protein
MKKIKLTVARRDIIEEYGLRHIRAGIDRSREAELLQMMIEEANKAIRAKYPEEDMAVIRKHKLERIDRCLRFQFPSGRVDGFSFASDAPIADMPIRGGCQAYNPWGHGEVFPVSERFVRAFDDHAATKKASDKLENDKISSLLAFVRACKTVEEVLEVIDLPTDIRDRLGHQSMALVAVTADTVSSLRATFKQAA